MGVKLLVIIRHGIDIEIRLRVFEFSTSASMNVSFKPHRIRMRYNVAFIKMLNCTVDKFLNLGTEVDQIFFTIL